MLANFVRPPNCVCLLQLWQQLRDCGRNDNLPIQFTYCSYQNFLYASPYFIII